MVQRSQQHFYSWFWGTFRRRAYMTYHNDTAAVQACSYLLVMTSLPTSRLLRQCSKRPVGSREIEGYRKREREKGERDSSRWYLHELFGFRVLLSIGSLSLIFVLGQTSSSWKWRQEVAKVEECLTKARFIMRRWHDLLKCCQTLRLQ